MPHVEERERYMQVVGDWLARHDWSSPDEAILRR